MSGQCIVTPGYLPPDGQPITEAQLRQVASPTVQLDENSVTEREIDAAALQQAVGNAIRPNIFVNGNFTEERWIAATISAPSATDTVLAEGWVANPTGAAITYGQSTVVPNADAAMCAMLTGAAGVTTVDFAQNLPRSASTLLYSNLMFSAWVFNNTGADFAPSLVVSTANAENDFTAVTEQLNIPLVTCKNQQWTQVTQALTPGAYNNRSAGMRVALRFAADTLDAGGKTISIASAKLEVGAVPTGQPWDNGPDSTLLKAALVPVINSLPPVGAGMDYWSDDLPLGWIWADGQPIDRTKYAALFAKWGTRYGVGDGATTFGVPDKRHRVSAGKGTMGGTVTPALLTAAISGVDGDTLGAVGGDQRLQTHTHNSRDTYKIHGGGNLVAGGTNAIDDQTQVDWVPTQTAGAGASQNVQPTIICNYIIFAGVFA